MQIAKEIFQINRKQLEKKTNDIKKENKFFRKNIQFTILYSSKISLFCFCFCFDSKLLC